MQKERDAPYVPIMCPSYAHHVQYHVPIMCNVIMWPSCAMSCDHHVHCHVTIMCNVMIILCKIMCTLHRSTRHVFSNVCHVLIRVTTISASHDPHLLIICLPLLSRSGLTSSCSFAGHQGGDKDKKVSRAKC